VTKFYSSGPLVAGPLIVIKLLSTHIDFVTGTLVNRRSLNKIFLFMLLYLFKCFRRESSRDRDGR
jgi:hypothetical protein